MNIQDMSDVDAAAYIAAKELLRCADPFVVFFGPKINKDELKIMCDKMRQLYIEGGGKDVKIDLIPCDTPKRGGTRLSAVPVLAV